MTISNSNLLSILAASSDVSLDNMMAGQLKGEMETLPFNIDASDQSQLKGDFWAMLNQQLAEINATDDLQDTENKQLFGSLEMITVDQESANESTFSFSFSSENNTAEDIDGQLAKPENAQAVDWMHSMKTHFSESETAVIEDEEPEVVAINTQTEELKPLPDTPELIVAAVNLVDEGKSAKQQFGDKLPPSRQVDSVELPPLRAALVVESNNNGSMASVVSAQQKGDTELTDMESDDGLLSSRQTDVELLKSDKTDAEKLPIKQPVVEQSVVVARDSAPVVLTAVTPLSSQESLAPLNQPVSTSLQTLQLSPEASSKQWGDALGERVSVLLNQKLNTAEIRIDPPNLGKLDIQIQLKDDTATVVIHTQHAQTRDMIESASVRLKEFLQEAGYDSVNVDVSHREESMAQDDFSEQQQSGQNENGDQQLSAEDQPSGFQQSELLLSVNDGRIDYFA